MIVFFGPVGAGKSVQGQMLAEKLGWQWLSTGQMFRDTANAEAKAILASGELMSDEKTFAVVNEAFADKQDAKRIILDGFPRTMPQAEWLINGDNQLGRSLAMVIALNISDDEILKRLSLRGRDEDAPDRIKRRMEIYRAETNPILGYFENHHVPVAHIDGDAEVEQVHQDILAAIKQTGLTE